jgi:hypothetical protein
VQLQLKVKLSSYLNSFLSEHKDKYFLTPKQIISGLYDSKLSDLTLFSTRILTIFTISTYFCSQKVKVRLTHPPPETKHRQAQVNLTMHSTDVDL